MPKKKKKAETVREVDKQLHIACRELSPSKMIEAIAAGADVNAPDSKHEYAPIDMVVNNVTINDREHYFSDLKKQENVHKAIDILLEHGADPDGITGDDTPLEFFSWLFFDHYVVRRLCKAGANVNAISGSLTLYDLLGMESIFLESRGDEENLKKLEEIEKTLRYFGAKSIIELQDEADNQSGQMDF